MRPEVASVRSILVIKPRAAGDVVLASPVLLNLHRALPHATLEVLTERPFADLVHGLPGVSGVVVYDRARMSGLDLIRSVRRRRYDMVIDLFGNPRTALVTFLSGARVRVGFRFGWRGYAYTIRLVPRGASVHNVEFNLDALRGLNVPVVDTSPVVPYTSADLHFVEEFFDAAGVRKSPDAPGAGKLPGAAGGGGKTLVAVNSSGGWYTKRWGRDRFAALCDILIRDHNCSVVLTWGPGEREHVESIRATMRETPLLPPATTFPQLAALLSMCDAVISNDTGPMHIAAAVGTPVLGIFGPTNPSLQGPYGPGHLTIRNESLTCLGCNLTACPIPNGVKCRIELEDGVLKMLGQLATMASAAMNAWGM
jgi:ADP-heptose:LPS heptosyltransferase